jgi:hypothetical protein
MSAPVSTPRVSPHEEPTTKTSPDRRHARRWQHLVDAVVVAVGTSLAVVWAYRLWDADLHVPLTYVLPSTTLFAAGDATFHQAIVTALLQGHWWTTNPDLGAPFGQQLYDFPLGPDQLHLVMLSGLAHLTGNAFLAVNLYFLGGYVLIALVSWAVLRRLGLGRATAVGVAVLFAFTPFHQGQGETHLFLADYVAVPLAALLLNWQLTGFAEWGPGGRLSAPGGLTWRRLLAVLAIALVIGQGSSYFAFFALVLLVLTALAQAVVRRSPRPLAGAVVLAGAPSAVLLASLAPAILYQHDHGANLTLARPAIDSWTLGLDLAQLVSPVEGHRIPALARLSTSITQALGWSEPGNNLGLVGVAGLVGLVLLVAHRLLRSGAVGSASARFRSRQAWLALLALLVATTGGLSVLIAVLGPTQVRVWARMSVFIAFFVLCAVGSWLDDWFRTPRPAVVRRWSRPAHGRLLRWPVVGAIVVVGLLDQTTSTYTAAQYRQMQTAFASDAQFGAAATSLLGPGSMVFQLPVVRFPEGGFRINGMWDYDELKAYMHAPELRWSYGSVKGRPQADWQAQLAFAAPEAVVVDLATAGFAGLYIDTEGYADHGRALVGTVRRLLDEDPLRSPDGRLALFDLRSLRDRLVARFGEDEVQAVGRDVTDPLVPAYGPGFYPQQPAADSLSRLARASAAFVFDNPSDTERSVQFGFSTAALSGTGRLTATTGDASVSVDLTTSPQPVDLQLTLPPGRTTVDLASTAPRAAEPDPRQPDARFGVSGITVISDQRTAMVQACRPASDTAGLSC